MSGLFRNADVRWGEGATMTDFEAMMWRAEADPILSSSGVVAELLEHAPPWDRLLDAHAWAVQRVPRLRDRVVEDPLHVGPPAWATTEIDLTHHVARRVLPDGATFDDALAVVAEEHMRPFDRARPLWRTTLIEGLPDGRALFAFKVHHALADGAALMQLLDLLHSDRRDATPDKPTQEAPHPSPDGPAGVVLRNARDVLSGSIRAGVRAARRLPGIARDPVGAASATAGYAASLGRVAAAVPATPSPLLRQRSLERHLVAIDVPLADLRAGAKAAGGSLNDAFLAALTGGLARYHRAHGCPVDDLPIALPVSLRTDDDAAGGNRFAGARIAAPVGEDDPARRMALIRERVLAARDEPALDFMGVLSPVASRVPTAALTRMTASATSGSDLQASNVRGLSREAYLAGAHVERMYPFGPVPGCPMMAVLISHEQTCCIALTIDLAAVPDPDVLARCMREGFAEVVALAG